ncbi:MAG: methyltransferase domain-containing protein [Candidatus Firestonebacteria bacterium]|nr:methyltransferase domain-containing protein [Candidatus Firestonebacteria bacterium]
MSALATESVEEKILSRKWFYEFKLPSGRKTEMYIPRAMAEIHDTRLSMLFSVLDPMFEGRWQETSCLDIASHEGFFASRMAARGCREVLGLDARPEHVTHATWIKEAYGYNNLSFQVADVRTINAETSTPADIVVMFGLIYHLENPVQALHLAAKLTKKVCLVETQVTPNISGMADWGACHAKKEMLGTFTIIDEMAETDRPEASVSGISLCPSKEAVMWLMRRFGFSRVEVVAPPLLGYEQLVSGNRIIVAGYKD